MENLTNAKLPLFVLEGAVLLPGGVARLETDQEGAERVRALAGKSAEQRRVVVALSTDDHELGVQPIATLARVEAVAGDGGVIVSAVGRVQVIEIGDEQPLPMASVELLEPARAAGAEIEALVLEARRLARDILAFLPGVPAELAQSIDAIKDPGALADALAHQLPVEPAEKQKVLESLDVTARLRLVVALLARRREVLKTAFEIEGAVQKSVSKAEREHLLRRKLEAIRAELGEGPETDGDALFDKLSKLPLPVATRAEIDKEVARLKRLPEASPERHVARTWLGFIAELPWGVETPDNLEVDNARDTLDRDHHGLAKVKKRVLQFLSVRKLRGDLKGPILCFVGPPGVGKTSLGQSIARAMGRKFVRVSLGGVRDEAEIRGHRRTYVGAMPGRIAQALKRAGSSNPVIMLDEIDKLGAGFQGDPAAALLEVLDPEQNHAFVDHYLEVPIDLSKALFIATANELGTISAPLRDRMEIIEIPSYTLEEKAAIARAHLLPRQLEAHGLKGADIAVSDAALERVIAAHTREAGVRALEKRIADLCRSLAVEKASGTLQEPRRIDGAEIETLLGPDRFQPEIREDAQAPGVAAGLAWTPVGGEVLYIESLRMPGRGQLILSGQLGNVMQESARAALSYVKANAAALGVPADPLKDVDVHVHVPAGATPKDGPSAGVTLFTALVSLLSGIPVRADTAMTGEATLRGRVLPVGGIKEKVLAAHRLGLRRVVLPEACAAELREVPQAVRDQLEIVLVKRMDEVLDAALVRPQPQLRVAA
ncbi:MAG TPA: endopeptidase La [Myxococcales bacterium]|nr:endopeptidase La [Myxococcales bacterium]